ncbi:putative transcriptional regulatory protein YvfU [Alicyclobacillus hesperidum]|uniref:Transcriptional regulatory protein YvfU n=1 Tax=Alicyclobacillus hesperidum TaxID=89784 RepID=A0A1H2VCT4_9BACL|nr:response regulator transcription factor [Alicyclobacillus hesperidum]GLV14648.1 putative transcriptional regulatory protein YvfU [Alicyclobacillus hesperidum]SDW66145.1 two component transcriptional regulator, LuxR family [Alicyclobacillus hesperidum]
MIRILLAEDQMLVCDALATLLDFEDDMTVIARASDGLAAVREAKRAQPDIALLDVEMPHQGGLDAAEEILQSVPDCKVILLTTFARPGYMQRAIQAGAHGYLLKDGEVEQLAAAIRAVMRGERIFHPALMMAAIASENPLSMRERDVLRGVKNGLTTKELARDLSLSEGTVRNYLSEAISKMNCTSRQDAVRRAESMGWL